MERMRAHITVREEFCIEEKPDIYGMVIFGASGDLAHRKLIPALFALFRAGLLPKSFFVLGFARTRLSDDEFRERVLETLRRAHPDADASETEPFVARFSYLAGDYLDRSVYETLKQRLIHCDEKFCNITGGNRLFYLAVPPRLYGEIVQRLGAAGLAEESERGERWSRVVIEKPFGRDLDSAIALDRDLRKVLAQRQIYRMDHYLGKETVQNILMFRFANSIFEPVWDRRYIDHVQITVAESVGVEHRAGYYESAGLLRDMFQNHMLQMLALVAMESPTSFHSERVRDEKVKLFRSIRPFPLGDLASVMVRGQYLAGEIEGKKVPGYREEPEVAPDSNVETFVAAKMYIDNWRWQGVPFYLRSGKRMNRKLSEVAIAFKKVPHSLFEAMTPEDLPPNVLVLKIQPEEGVSLTMNSKQPGPKYCMSLLTMDFHYREVFGIDPPDAYQRLLLDCMLGDQTLFWRRDGVELAWSLLTPVLSVWENEPEACPLTFYPAGSWGPEESEELLACEGLAWRYSG